jgi:hypothetical protein
MDGLQERVDLAIKSGDAEEVRRLVSSEWGISSIARRARDVLAGITKGKPVTPGQALHHCLLIALETGNQLAVAKAECSGLRRRIEALEQRLADTQTNNSTAYRGVWCEEDVPYRPGELVTHKGTLWHAWKVTSDRPGASNDWQLMVKHARD